MKQKKIANRLPLGLCNGGLMAQWSLNGFRNPSLPPKKQGRNCQLCDPSPSARLKSPTFSLYASILFSLHHSTSIMLGSIPHCLAIGCKVQTKDKDCVSPWNPKLGPDTVTRYNFEESMSVFIYTERRVRVNVSSQKGTGDMLIAI